MVIYEVNLAIDTAIYTDFISWLHDHVKEILRIPGFIQASLLKEEHEKNQGQEKFTVQYRINNREDLERYFTEYAAQMRAEGIRRFGNQFSATRRIFNVENDLSNK